MAIKVMDEAGGAVSGAELHFTLMDQRFATKITRTYSYMSDANGIVAIEKHAEWIAIPLLPADVAHSYSWQWCLEKPGYETAQIAESQALLPTTLTLRQTSASTPCHQPYHAETTSHR